MKIQFECLYCGYKWIGYANSYRRPECDRCHDKSIKARELDTDNDPFGYKKDLEQAQLLRDQGTTYSTGYNFSKGLK